MTVQRPAAVAGRFYPRRPEVLRDTVTAMLDAVEVPDDDVPARGYVVPHAGYRFSGPVAAQVYARIRRHRDRIDRIVLVGPSHFVPLTGAAASGYPSWATPLGPVDTAAPEGIRTDEAAHEQEHSLEVQLPFLQCALGEQARFTVVPVVIGRCTVTEARDTIDSMMDDSTLLLCSTDLSHYHDEPTAIRLDRATADAVLAGDPQRIGVTDACGVFALRGTVAWAARHGLSTSLLRLGTSADTYGGSDRVVGYPAFAFGTGSDSGHS